MQTIDVGLQRIAAAFQIRDALARLCNLILQRIATLLGGIHRLAQLAHFLLATDDARMDVLVAADAQPIAADPNAIARDDGFAAEERRTLRQRLIQAVDRDDAAQERRNRGRTLHL